MNEEDIIVAKRRLKKIGILFLIHISIALVFLVIVLSVYYSVDTAVVEFRSFARGIVWLVVSLWEAVFFGYCVWLCYAICVYPKKSIWKEVCAFAVLAIFMFATIGAFLEGLLIFSLKESEKNITVADGEQYILKEDLHHPRGFSYHKIINPFLYEKEESTAIILFETYTGTVQSWEWRYGEEGPVGIIQGKVENGNIMEFTLNLNFTRMNGEWIKSSDKIPLGTKVEINCESYPNSDLHLISSIIVL